MKNIVLLMSILFLSSVYPLCAQPLHDASLERTALEDSVIVAGISRSVVDLALQTINLSSEQKLAAHWAHFEYLKEISHEPLKAFSDNELKEILIYLKSKAYRFTSSAFFLQLLTTNLMKAILCEVGQGGTFSYKLKDRTYAISLESGFTEISKTLMATLDTMFGEGGVYITNLRADGASDSDISLIRSVLEKMYGNFFEIYRFTLVDYLSNDDVQVFADFTSSSLGQKYIAYASKINELSEADTSRMQEIAECDPNADIAKSIAYYVSLSRAFPEYYPELCRPHLELQLKKSSYSGQTKEREPHGQGVLTTGKGIVYAGSFKEGKRHGLIEVHVPGKEPFLQFWIDDKYHKEVKTEGGQGVANPTLINGKYYGYGAYYDIKSQKSYEGMFVDGALNGIGQVSSNDWVEKGVFVDGKLVNGVISWFAEDLKTNTFRGVVSGNIRKGVHKWQNSDGSLKDTRYGYFIDGKHDGLGSRICTMPNQTTFESSGTFANGALYGPGTHKMRKVDGDTGTCFDGLYQGWFYNDLFHDKGTLVTTITDIQDNCQAIMTCNVRCPVVDADSLTIVLDGIFDRGSFISGKIYHSDGTWYEGTFGTSGLIDGKMKRRYSDGSVYEGECHNGIINGQGSVCYADGSTYAGNFIDGKPAGYNRNVESGDSQEGNTIALQTDGLVEKTLHYGASRVSKGTARLLTPFGVKILVRHSSALEVSCKGRFDGDVFLSGKVTMSDGYWMYGDFEDGVLISGKARTIDKYGTIYEGDIKNGYPHGYGKCIYSNGTWFKGKFANGNRMEGTHFSAEGEVIKVYD